MDWSIEETLECHAVFRQGDDSGIMAHVEQGRNGSLDCCYFLRLWTAFCALHIDLLDLDSATMVCCKAPYFELEFGRQLWEGRKDWFRSFVALSFDHICLHIEEGKLSRFHIRLRGGSFEDGFRCGGDRE